MKILKTINLSVVFLFTFISCELKEIDNLIQFDDTTSIEVVSSDYNSEFYISDEVLWIQANPQKEFSNINIKGDWDLSKYNELIIELINPEGEDLSVYVGLESAGNEEDDEKGNYITLVSGSSKSLKQLKVKVPAKLPYPQIRKKFVGMRTNPYQTVQTDGYGFRGQKKSLNPEIVTEISVIVKNEKLNCKWGIKSIKGKSGQPEKIVHWKYLAPEEFFPFIDIYGQFIHKDWPSKTDSDRDLKIAVKEEVKDLESHPGPKDRSKYGGWKGGPKYKATGNFYVKKINDQWWLIDPEGYLFWSHGVVRVTPSSGMTPLDDRKFYFKNLPSQDSPFAEFYTTRDELLFPFYKDWGVEATYDFSASNLYRKYGKNWRDKFANLAHRRIKSWGLNTISNGSDREIYLLGKTPYTERIEIFSPDIEGSEKSWKKFKDPFHPDFRINLREELSNREQELNDPWCIGFFIDNEVIWGQENTSLAKWTIQSPESQPAKIEFLKFLKKKYHKIDDLNHAWETDYPNWTAFLETEELPTFGTHSIEDFIQFTEVIIETYFKNIRDEFKAFAPNKLYLGCRFNGLLRFADSYDTIVKIAAKYCDIVSQNLYANSLEDWSFPDIDKPVIIGEFHFGALDRGLFDPSLIITANQKERGKAYKNYVESALHHPNIVGTHWHQFSDQATTGRFDGENMQVGFTDVCDTPYPETIEKVREVGYNLYNIRTQNNKE